MQVEDMIQDEVGEREDTPDEALLRRLIAGIVFYPDAITIDTVRGSGKGSAVLNVEVKPEDHRFVVGKEGKNIYAFHELFRFVGAREKRTLGVMLIPPIYKATVQKEPFIPQREWEGGPTYQLFRDVLDRLLLRPYQVGILELETMTTFDLQPDKCEILFAQAFQPHLHTIFHAIGNKAGRQLYVRVSTPIEVPLA